MFRIGEFSKVTGLTVKTLRFYHAEGLLVPRCVDDETGYRYYAAEQVETARVIARLRELDFPVSAIAEILAGSEDADVLGHLERRRGELAARLRHDRDRLRAIDQVLRNTREAEAAMKNATFTIEEKTLSAVTVAGVRMKGRYSDIGQGFSRIGKAAGRWIRGMPLCLFYDGEYREEDAEFEPCFPVQAGKAIAGAEVRELPGGRCVTLMHQGPYPELGRSYERLLKHVHERGLTPLLPTREVYHKGPGMIFKGNPKRYLTEIQVLVE